MWNVLQWLSQSPGLYPTEHVFHLQKVKLKAKMPLEQAGAEDHCSKGLPEHYQDTNTEFSDVYGIQTSLTAKDLQPKFKMTI